MCFKYIFLVHRCHLKTAFAGFHDLSDIVQMIFGSAAGILHREKCLATGQNNSLITPINVTYLADQNFIFGDVRYMSLSRQTVNCYRIKCRQIYDC